MELGRPSVEDVPRDSVDLGCRSAKRSLKPLQQDGSSPLSQHPHDSSCLSIHHRKAQHILTSFPGQRATARQLHNQGSTMEVQPSRTRLRRRSEASKGQGRVQEDLFQCVAVATPGNLTLDDLGPSLYPTPPPTDKSLVASATSRRPSGYRRWKGPLAVMRKVFPAF